MSFDDPSVCPYTIERPVMMQRWATLTFLHWSFDAAAVQRLLPDSLTVETFEDRAWVGLVPFFMHVSLPHVPEVPWVSRFCETNVRTYVRGRDGPAGYLVLLARRGASRRSRHCAHHVPAPVLLVEDGVDAARVVDRVLV